MDTPSTTSQPLLETATPQLFPPPEPTQQMDMSEHPNGSLQPPAQAPPCAVADAIQLPPTLTMTPAQLPGEQVDVHSAAMAKLAGLPPPAAASAPPLEPSASKMEGMALVHEAINEMNAAVMALRLKDLRSSEERMDGFVGKEVDEQILPKPVQPVVKGVQAVQRSTSNPREACATPRPNGQDGPLYDLIRRQNEIVSETHASKMAADCGEHESGEQRMREQMNDLIVQLSDSRKECLEYKQKLEVVSAMFQQCHHNEKILQEKCKTLAQRNHELQLFITMTSNMQVSTPTMPPNAPLLTRQASPSALSRETPDPPKIRFDDRISKREDMDSHSVANGSTPQVSPIVGPIPSIQASPLWSTVDLKGTSIPKQVHDPIRAMNPTTILRNSQQHLPDSGYAIQQQVPNARHGAISPLHPSHGASFSPSPPDASPTRANIFSWLGHEASPAMKESLPLTSVGSPPQAMPGHALRTTGPEAPLQDSWRQVRYPLSSMQAEVTQTVPDPKPKVVQGPTLDPQERREHYRSILIQIYSKHNPMKLGEVENILDMFRGNEDELLMLLALKYDKVRDVASVPVPPAPAGSSGK